ncbi:MAG: hypothetical protein WA517_21760 [Candidatus Acidiferrum sp.]
MRRLSPIAFPLGLLVFAPFVTCAQNSAQREKVAEGEYWEWHDGHALKDTSQTWTIWRTQNGYEVEDSLPPDKAAALFAVVGAASQGHMSPELREEFQNASTTTDIRLQLTKDGAIRELLLNGKKLSEIKQVQVAHCLVKKNEISCKGHEGTVRLRNSGQDQLVYSYPFPLLFTPMLKQLQPALNQTIPVKLAMMEEVKNKLQITEVPGQLQNQGTEKLSIGEYTFDAEKYALALITKSGPRQIVLWASTHGIVFAMEDSQMAPGLRVLLTQYKRHSDF